MVLFVLFPVNKDLDLVYHVRETEGQRQRQRQRQRESVVFCSNSLKMSVSFDKNL